MSHIPTTCIAHRSNTIFSCIELNFAMKFTLPNKIVSDNKYVYVLDYVAMRTNVMHCIDQVIASHVNG